MNGYRKQLNALRESLLSAIKSLLVQSNKKELELTKDSQRPYVLWYLPREDTWYDTAVMAVGMDECGELYLIVESGEEPVFLFSGYYHPALTHCDWLCEIYDNLLGLYENQDGH